MYLTVRFRHKQVETVIIVKFLYVYKRAKKDVIHSFHARGLYYYFSCKIQQVTSALSKYLFERDNFIFFHHAQQQTSKWTRRDAIQDKRYCKQVASLLFAYMVIIDKRDCCELQIYTIDSFIPNFHMYFVPFHAVKNGSLERANFAHSSFNV